MSVQKKIDDILNEVTVIKDFDDTLNSFRLHSQHVEGDFDGGELITDLGQIQLYTTKGSEWPIPFDGFTRIVFKDGDEVVGKASVEYRRSLPKIGSVAKVVHIWLDSAYRNKGNGFKFYSFLLDSGLNLISDDSQTRHSKKLWIALSKKYKTLTYDMQTSKQKDITDAKNVYRKGDRRYLILISPKNRLTEEKRRYSSEHRFWYNTATKEVIQLPIVIEHWDYVKNNPTVFNLNPEIFQSGDKNEVFEKVYTLIMANHWVRMFAPAIQTTQLKDARKALYWLMNTYPGYDDNITIESLHDFVTGDCPYMRLVTHKDVELFVKYGKTPEGSTF